MQDIKSVHMEGYLKKKKSEGSKNLFGKYTKRWFTLDFQTALFSYSAGEGKKVKQKVPLREVQSVEEPQAEEAQVVKKWEYEFTIVTQERQYQLFAKTEEDKKKWLDAFNEIISLRDNGDKDKKKKKKSKKKSKKKDKSEELDIDSIVKKGPKDTVQLEPPSPIDEYQPFESSYNRPLQKKSSNIMEEYAPEHSKRSAYNKQVTQMQEIEVISQRKNTSELVNEKYLKSSDNGSTSGTKISSGLLGNSSSGEHIHSNPSATNDQSDSNNKEISFEEDWDEDENYDSIKQIDSCKAIKKLKYDQLSGNQVRARDNNFVSECSIGKVQY